MIKPLSLSAYLAETLLFAVQTGWRLALTGTIVIVMAAILIGVLRALRIAPRSQLPQILTSSWAGWSVVALSSMLALLLIQITSVPGDLLVGPMDKDAVRRLTDYRWSQNVVGSTYELLWFFLVALGFVLVRHRTILHNEARSSVLLAWRIAWIPVVIGFITLPMIFGTFIRPILYPAAAVSWKLGEEQHFRCGVLVGDGVGSIVLWQQSGNYGAVVKIPEQAITSVATGPLIRPLAIRGDPGGPDAKILAGNCAGFRETLKT